MPNPLSLLVRTNLLEVQRGLQRFKKDRLSLSHFKKTPSSIVLDRPPLKANQLYTHGSNSSSFIGVTRLGGLYPSGWLEKQTNIVSFSGELAKGSFHPQGVNKRNISLTYKPDVAKRYSQKSFNNQGWTPENSHNVVQELETNTYRRSEMDLAEFFDFRIALEKKRQTIFQTLGDTERQLITEPFPVIYGLSKEQAIKTPKRFTWFRSSDARTLGEVGYDRPIRLRSKEKSHPLEVYVPEEKIDLVKQYFSQQGYPDARIFSLEILS